MCQSSKSSKSFFNAGRDGSCSEQYLFSIFIHYNQPPCDFIVPQTQFYFNAPLGWSREGLKLMAKLRVFSKNGGDLKRSRMG
jgi:hypothetical protein